MTRYFPIFLDLENRLAVVVGGNAVAWRKAKLLIGAGARIRVVAPRLDPDFSRWLIREQGEHRASAFVPADLDGSVLAIAATGEETGDAAVAEAARARFLPVNAVDRPALCSFIMPAVVDRSPLVVAISSGGTSPVLTQLVKMRIESMLPGALGQLAAFAGALRNDVRRRLSDAAARRRFWVAIFSGPVAELISAGRWTEGLQLLRRQLDRSCAGRPGPPMGMVHYVEDALGEIDHLTLKALRLLQEAEIVVHDETAAPAVLALARSEARRIPADLDATERLVALAGEGARVVRLIGTGALARSRREAEQDALIAHGIEFGQAPSTALACEPEAEPYLASRSSSPRTASPIALVETGVLPLAAMSAVRLPEASTFLTAFSTKSASSGRSKE